ncbi:peptidylprolyl isomerase [Burkholderia thailandensis]|uniref:Chaperone SurA n=1 Tax=Burkholderia thailandensis (strain ATCC 700388 / DSM 13276 / CCUG 48851 / CIP 106301 / E264) TaxID=271848 RepID=SURA_BURTA|nr:peptidylprolyl isomerase [Burkholderia thailandensis]Q2T116.1 RecName: Full=Chaperone SurA; AltName: Full=Peptidyl-prolyl cis-trans isomerase SurA; Short=PPIase SurA; AltName: Full=Rotamase SurA; Flags: Precursor [Burkholderia thailandensis E264]ABC38226.1 survival protein SurA, putative [Burkholderia thailandensis E264]AHI72945.1 PPIC-type PPIASE domain protein [Burkholderia thailandensis 2002721723]AHI77461.1 PPIC-type PPIASE domain protein [Burkholderia thailandensis E444]AIC86187.1 PPIC
MKKTLRFAAVAAGLVASLITVAPSASAQALRAQGASLADEVVAVVNNDVITGRELDQRVGLIARRLQQQKAPVPPTDQLRAQVLNQMVLERIQVQRAKDDGIVVDNATVQATLGRLAQANGMPLDQYKARIEAQGVPWDLFVRDARTELMLSKLREKEVDSKITVSDAEVASYIASQRGPNAGAQQDLRLEHIFVKAPTNAPQADIDAAQKKAEGLLQQALASGTNFERLAKSQSEADDAKKGGDLGFKAPSSLPSDVVDAVSKLRPGEVNPTLIRVPDGFEIVRLVDRRASQNPAASPKIVQTHVRHILLRVGEGKSESQARQQLIDIRRQIEAGGDFEKFARTYSQDGSASQGGDLGWISPGETVPEFERAMNALQDGQVSNPVRTEYGYHLIQVLGRRDAEGSVQQQMDIARQAIGQRKAEQAYSDWLRELRDSSYVQIKLPVGQ